MGLSKEIKTFFQGASIPLVLAGCAPLTGAGLSKNPSCYDVLGRSVPVGVTASADPLRPTQDTCEVSFLVQGSNISAWNVEGGRYVLVTEHRPGGGTRGTGAVPKTSDVMYFIDSGSVYQINFTARTWQLIEEAKTGDRSSGYIQFIGPSIPSVLREEEKSVASPPSEIRSVTSKEGRLAYGRNRLPDYFPDSVRYWVMDMERWENLYGIPLMWQAAIITNESCADQDARNPRSLNESLQDGDYGLFQVNYIHVAAVPFKDRLKPEVNAKYALEYAHLVFRSFPNDNYKTALAYTAGIGATRRGEASKTKKAYAGRVANMLEAVKDPQLLTSETKKWLAAQAPHCFQILSRLP